jgi:hypothetical protein
VESMWHRWCLVCKDAGRASSVVGWMLKSSPHLVSQMD